MKNLNRRLKKLENRMSHLIDGYWFWPAKREAWVQCALSMISPEEEVFIRKLNETSPGTLRDELIKTHPALWESCNELIHCASVESPPPYWMSIFDIFGDTS
jgi:hypothetical protein